MNEVRLSRLLVWAGPLFAVVFLGISFLTGSAPGADSSAAKITNYYDDHRTVLLWSVFLTPLGCALLLGFVAAVRMRARENGNDGGPGLTIMTGGAVLWAAGMLTGSMITLALVDAADKNKIASAGALNFLADASWLPFIGGIAVFLVGAGLASLRSRTLPNWFAWITLAAGIVSLAGPGGFIGFFAAPLFVFVAGIVLATRQPESVPVG
jgi:hypothetical protein